MKLKEELVLSKTKVDRIVSATLTPAVRTEVVSLRFKPTFVGVANVVSEPF